MNSKPNPIGPLGIGFSFIIALMGTITGIGIYYLSSYLDRLNSVVSEELVQSSLAREMYKYSRERNMMLHAMIQARDPIDRDEIFTRFRGLGTKFLIARNKLLKTRLNVEERRLLADQRAGSANVAIHQYKVIEFLEQNQNRAAIQHLIKKAIPAQDYVVTVIERFIRLQQIQIDKVYEDTASLYSRNRNTIFLFGLSGLLASIVITFHVLRRARASQQVLENQVQQRTNELYEANRKLSQLARYDTITGLPNRNMFNEQIQMAVNQARRHNDQVALLFMDLDGFKEINDRYGHKTGDMILKETADRLQQAVRDTDFVARIGGDEFTVLVGDLSDAEYIHHVAKRIIHNISRPYLINEETNELGVSIGISIYPDDTTEIETLIRMADHTMYQVKRDGKNNYRLCGPNLHLKS